MSSISLIDTHCHLDYDYSPLSQEEIIQKAISSGIQKLVTVSVDASSPAILQKIAEKNLPVYFTAGKHPHEAKDFQENHIEVFRQFAKHPKCVAIGEIGLDYYYKNSSPEEQLIALKAQLKLAQETKLPVIIHSRDAEAELFEELKSYALQVNQNYCPGIIHCFTGTQNFGQKCIELGFMVSFSGILTFKNAQDLREAAKSYPLESLLVETDAPFLAPVPFRGKKCEPSMVIETAKLLAEIKSVSFEELAKQTSLNAYKVFTKMR